MGSLFERLASGAETAGAFGMSLITQPPGIAPPPHLHTREAEAFYVLDGTLIYQAGEELHHLAAGSFIYLPMLNRKSVGQRAGGSARRSVSGAGLVRRVRPGG